MTETDQVFEALHGTSGSGLFSEQFAKVRAHWQVEEKTILEEWRDPEQLQQSGSAGKGGSFFVRSKLGACFMVKSLTASETRLLRSTSFVADYVSHMISHPASMLLKVYGIYCTRKKIHFMLIQDVLHFSVKPKQIFDLKGSLVHRRAAPDAKVMLDYNWLESFDGSLYFGAQQRENLMDQLESDSAFLAQHKLMDYSLLVGIIPCSPMERDNMIAAVADKPYAFVSEDKNFIYLLTVIDYLQDYNAKKKFAHAVKSLYNDATLLSTVAPPLYKKRFVAFMGENVLKDKSALAVCWEKTWTMI